MKSEGGLQNQLRAIRTRLGLSQQELANAADVARQTIGGIENGDYAPSAFVALRLARALGCRVEELFWLPDASAILEAVPAQSLPTDRPMRVTLAQIGEHWIAHPLMSDAAFRTEMVPADGTGRCGAGEKTFSVTLLDEAEALARTVVLAGCAPALSLWARSAERWYPGLRVHWSHANSTDALALLRRGEVHAAGIHFSGESGADNAGCIRQIFPGAAITLVHLGAWEEGLLTAADNPKRLRVVADLMRPNVRLINREVGASSRLLLDSRLAQEQIAVSSLPDYTARICTGHVEVARAIANGAGDVGVGIASVAAAYNLHFLPLQSVRYDLAFRTETLASPPVQQLLGTLHHRWVRSQLAALGGYDTAQTGDNTPVAPVPA